MCEIKLSFQNMSKRQNPTIITDKTLKLVLFFADIHCTMLEPLPQEVLPYLWTLTNDDDTNAAVFQLY